MSLSSRRAVSIRIGTSWFGPVAADRAADRDAVDAGQHQVEDDQVERLGAGARERLLAVADRLDLEALEAEVQHDQLADVRFVFDDEDP